jgi:hypothetical protein
MTISGREIIRRAAHLPVLDRIGAWVEDAAGSRFCFLGQPFDKPTS